jgi:hypothetical protein
MFIQRYHSEMKVSASGVYWVLKRYGLNRLPRNAKRRTITTHRYEKQVPGHHIQVDVKFLSLKDRKGKKIRRFQYTAIDDATRIRAIKIFGKHNQATAIKFIFEPTMAMNFKLASTGMSRTGGSATSTSNPERQDSTEKSNDHTALMI